MYIIGIHCINSYSTGDLNGTYVGGVAGSALWNNSEENIFKNCYYLTSSTVTKSSGRSIVVDAIGLNLLNQETIEQFNTYIDANSDGLDTSEWVKWEIDNENNPQFVE